MTQEISHKKYTPFFSQLQEGNQLFIPGSSAEPRDLVEAFAAQGSALPAIQITHSFVSGVNPRPLASAENSITETAFFPRDKDLTRKGRINFLPVSYYGANQYLSRQYFDWACIQVSPPDSNGNCCLGPAMEFLPVVLANSKKILGIINPNVPQISGSGKIPVDRLDLQLESSAPLTRYDTGSIDSVSSQIAEHLTQLIEPGAVLQLGLGKVPSKLASTLKAFNNLRFHSGMLSDGFVELANAGVLDPDFAHTTCCALGSSEFYNSLNSLEQVNIKGVIDTHNPANLSEFCNLTAVNSALDIDLWGQANLEMIGSRQISSVAGAADFARAARNSQKGKSIIALPATASKGTASRIRAQFNPGQVISLGRTEIDYVVTEFGVAELSGKSPNGKARALINIAAPEFREQLTSEWNALL